MLPMCPMQPIDLQEWTKQYPINKEMFFKEPAERSITSFYDFRNALINYKYDQRDDIKAINTHSSKSITLPVVEITTPFGVKCIIRDNFYDIKVSVTCPSPCDHDLFGLTAGGDDYLDPVYFEGFDKSLVYDPFVLGCDKFSVSLGSENMFLAFAKALAWKFSNKYGDEVDDYPNNDMIGHYLYKKVVAERSGIPVIYSIDHISTLYRFFSTDTDFIPYKSKVDSLFVHEDGPVQYVSLDFSSGCPKPIDQWLKILNEIVGERRKGPFVDSFDRKPANIKVNRMSPEMISIAKELGCNHLLE